MILNLCVRDWANYSHENANALRSIGEDCMDIKVEAHPWAYPSESTVMSAGNMTTVIRAADVIQIMHTDMYMLRRVQSLLRLSQKVVVYHTGSYYRRNPQGCNAAFNPVVDISFTDQCEFFDLGAKNMHYIATCVDVNRFPKKRELGSPIVIAHYPSNKEVKGTDKIIDMMKGFHNGRFEFKCSVENVTHADHIKRVAECDIYIEMFKPELNGKPYGCYGVTAFEAAACGKVVITQNINPLAYRASYGDMPFLIANNEDEFMDTLYRLVAMHPDEIRILQWKTWAAIAENHSYEATGKRIMKLLSQ